MVVEPRHADVAYATVFGASRSLSFTRSAVHFLEQQSVVTVDFEVVGEIGGGDGTGRSHVGEEKYSDGDSECDGSGVDVV